MTPLEGLLIRRIAVGGSIDLATYMAECLLHPEHGYYTTRTPFGAAGDFITAPEISQMFGELLGLCLAQSWLDQGCPDEFTLAEIGPGRGTLMADLLRATRGIAGFHAAAEIALVEASPALRAEQKRKLGDAAVRWVGNLSDLADAPLFLIANEFFDALPVRQFQRLADGWAETVVGVVDGHLALGQRPAPHVPALHGRLGDTSTGNVVEICPQAALIMTQIADRINRFGGAAIVIDYGGWRSLGDTVQAMRNHAPVPILHCPGQSDLTAHVDFAALADAARPCETRYTTQGQLLAGLGIAARSARLATGLRDAALTSHLAATRRLTAPEEMGSLFKALAVHSPRHQPPPGFT